MLYVCAVSMRGVHICVVCVVHVYVFVYVEYVYVRGVCLVHVHVFCMSGRYVYVSLCAVCTPGCDVCLVYVRKCVYV